MQKKIYFLIILVVLFFSSASFALSPGAIVGLWYTKDSKSQVKIYKCGMKYCGKIIWLKEPVYKEEDKEAGKPKRDRNNPDTMKKNNPIIGLPLLWGFVFEDGIWEGGRIYDPENGKTYKCRIKLEGNKLKVRGYIGFSFIGRTAIWTRANN